MESNSNIKYPTGKSIFAVNLTLKLLLATVANTDTESIKSPHTLFETFFIWIIWIIWIHYLNTFVHYLNTLFGTHTGEIWTKSYGPKCKKSWAFWQKKTEFFKTIFHKASTQFCKTFLFLKQLFNGKLLISRLLSFSVPKNMVVWHV